MSAQRLSDTQRRILEFIARADGDSCVLAAAIAAECNLSPRGMGGRMVGLWLDELITRKLVKPAPSPRSDALYGWRLTQLGREAIR